MLLVAYYSLSGKTAEAVRAISALFNPPAR
jgi:hypothetical protein